MKKAIPLETDPEVSGVTTLQKLVVRSGIAGRDGEIEFCGSEELLKFLGFSEVEHSSECEYLLSVSDAHSGKTYSLAEKITGNRAYGLFGGSIDIEWEGMSGLEGTWIDSIRGGRYETRSTGTFSSMVHLADNALTLQVGANEGEKFILKIGDMSADALGIDRVNIMSHDRAARSITVIDNALDKVLTQRANIGASENALEHTMSSLVVSQENLTAAESRVRNADIAKVMMLFTKINIMRQTNMSMLA
ncbi:MAG: flagellin, partial [Synergistaceae bacterium]|nr:flagellin [Synergistaceae bacterium]